MPRRSKRIFFLTRSTTRAICPCVCSTAGKCIVEDYTTVTAILHIVRGRQNFVTERHNYFILGRDAENQHKTTFIMNIVYYINNNIVGKRFCQQFFCKNNFEH